MKSGVGMAAGTHDCGGGYETAGNEAQHILSQSQGGGEVIMEWTFAGFVTTLAIWLILDHALDMA